MKNFLIDIGVGRERLGLLAVLFHGKNGWLKEFSGGEAVTERFFKILGQTLEDGILGTIEADTHGGGGAGGFEI